jgi:hypothetical protein
MSEVRWSNDFDDANQRVNFVVPSTSFCSATLSAFVSLKEKIMAVVTRCVPDDSPAWFDSKAATISFSLTLNTI